MQYSNQSERSCAQDCFEHSTPKSRGLVRSFLAVAGSICAVVAFCSSVVLPTHAFADDLDQTISPDQGHCTGRVLIDRGHLDFGPNLSSGKWKIEIHDDTGKTSCWRDPSQVIIHVNDAAKIPMPNDDRYSFIGEKPGTELWVIPQTQNRKVVWLGWNTQEPTVIEQLQQGMNLSFEKVSGPGNVDMYLENGNLGAPQPIWSTQTQSKPTWIEVNAHTHVNWIFHKPGAYRIRLKASGKLTNGKEVSDTQDLQFAVSNNVNIEQAFPPHQEKTEKSEPSKTEQEKTAPSSTSSSSQETSAQQSSQENTHESALLFAALAGVVALIVLVVVVLVVGKSRHAKREALREIAASTHTSTHTSEDK